MYTKDHFLMRRGQVLWGIVLGSALLGGLNGPAYAGDREADSGSVIIDAVKTSRGWKIKALQIVSDTTRLDTIRMERTSPTDGNKKP